jgi:hypothetical protein
MSFEKAIQQKYNDENGFCKREVLLHGDTHLGGG